MSADGVREPIDIKIVDPSGLTREERDIAKYRDLAREAEAIEKRLKRTKGGLLAGTGAPVQLTPEGFLPPTVTGGVVGGKVPRGALAAGVAPAGRANEFQKLRDKVDLIEKSDFDQSLILDEVTQKVSQFSNALRNPGDFVLNAITRVAGRQFVKVLGGIGAVILLATVIFQIFKKNFGPGGVLDIRKIIKDEALTREDLEQLLNIRAGKVYYTADTRVGQRVVQNSASESLTLQSQRYNELILGSDLSTG